MARFDLDSYETVAERLVRFWADNPDGRVDTRLLSYSEGVQTQFIVYAEIYQNRNDANPVASGMAEEQFQDRGPNQTSPIEVCETSAIGRALANWTYASDASKRPSREEMAKVERGAPARGVPAEVRASASPKPPKQDVTSDSRWETIKEGAKADPGNDFLQDLVKKGEQYGTLSEKQLGAGFNAAKKALASPAAGTMIKISEAFGASEEPF